MNLPFIRAEWDAPVQVHAGVTTRLGGVSAAPWTSLNLAYHVNDRPDDVRQNRQRLRQSLALPEEPVWLQQVHGVQVVDAAAVAGLADADASFTLQPGVVCAVMTADCLPVLFTDTAGRCVAAAHAGWRGLHAGVLEATVAAMPVPPRELLAWFGPAIGPSAFEVGPEVRQAFVDKLGDVEAAFRRGAGDRYFADIYALASLTLQRIGVSRLYGGGLCSYRDAARFYSYRREPVTGRMASLIWLEPEK